MFEPKQLKIDYEIDSSSGRKFAISIHVDEHGILQGQPEEGPEWTQRGKHGCAKCQVGAKHCRAAVAIAPVVDAFHDLDSLETVKARAHHAGRVVETECSAPRAVASIMGLLIAASGCTKTAPFRIMALYHLPFATAEETLTRAAGFCLLNHWAHGTLDKPDPFQNLIDTWERLEEVNTQLANRLLDITKADATSNSIVFLDALAKAGSMGLENRLKSLKTAFHEVGNDEAPSTEN